MDQKDCFAKKRLKIILDDDYSIKGAFEKKSFYDVLFYTRIGSQ